MNVYCSIYNRKANAPRHAPPNFSLQPTHRRTLTRHRSGLLLRSLDESCMLARGDAGRLSGRSVERTLGSNRSGRETRPSVTPILSPLSL